MTETFSGRIDGMDAEQYSMQHFEKLAEQARETEEKRIAESARVDHSISLDFSVALWLTDREDSLASLAKVIDILLSLGGNGRTTGTFKATFKMPSINTEENHDS